MRLAPSILTADFLQLGSQLEAVHEADEIHLDIMDGHFVPNMTFGPEIARAVRHGTKLRLSAHLMVDNPDEMAPWFVSAGCDEVIIHAEAALHLHRSIGRLKELGVAAGVALNPATPLEILNYIHQDISTVLLMTVNPGFGGQVFIPAALDKIRDLRTLRGRWDSRFTIAVDGGIHADNVAGLAEVGVDLAVVGSAVYGAGDPVEQIRKLRRALAN